LGFYIHIDESEIAIINDVLKAMIDKGSVSIQEVITMAGKDDVLANKLFALIELKGYAEKTKYGNMLVCNDHTKLIYDNNSVRQLFEEEFEARERNKKKDIETDLNIEEMRRNRILSWAAIWISIFAIIVSIVALSMQYLYRSI
jgi:hypothetical protein